MTTIMSQPQWVKLLIEVCWQCGGSPYKVHYYSACSNIVPDLHPSFPLQVHPHPHCEEALSRDSQDTNADTNLSVEYIGKVSNSSAGNFSTCRGMKEETSCNFSTHKLMWLMIQIDDLVQDCSISIVNALEILQSCTKPSKSSSYYKLSRTQCTKSEVCLLFHLTMTFPPF